MSFDLNLPADYWRLQISKALKQFRDLKPLSSDSPEKLRRQRRLMIEAFWSDVRDYFDAKKREEESG